MIGLRLRSELRHTVWASPSSGGVLKLLVCGAVGAVLAWQVVVHSGAAFLASKSPATALRLNRNDTVALVTVAQTALDQALGASPETRRGAKAPVATTVSASESGAISDTASRALLGAPYDARALRILAQIADGAGDKVQKQKLLEATQRRTKHEPLVNYWLLLDAFDRKDEAAILRHADMLLSSTPELTPFVVLILARMAEGSPGESALTARLRENPPWRAKFFEALPAAVTDAQTPLGLLLALKGSTAPPNHAEIVGYLDYLMRGQRYENAYYAWLQFLDAAALRRVALVHNGSFGQRMTSTPFDWTVPSSPGAIADVRQIPGEEGQALYVDFVGQGRVEFQPIQQTLVLTPGNYQLLVNQRGEISGRRGLQWSVVCAGTGTILGSTPMFTGRAPEWVEVQADIAVPAEGCRAQTLRLAHAARSPSEQIVSGTAWFTNVRLERRPGE
jgi:hypothetical protein